MFGNIGMQELILLAGVALVVMGPEKFPQFAKIAMRTVRELRGFWEDAKRDITDELRPVQREVRQLQQYKPEDYIDSLMGEDDEEGDGTFQGYEHYAEEYEVEDPYNYAPDPIESEGDAAESAASGASGEPASESEPSQEDVDDAAHGPAGVDAGGPDDADSEAPAANQDVAERLDG